MKTIKENLQKVSLLPMNYRGIFGLTQLEDKIIFINPDLRNSRYLTGKERTRLYMAHELGHIVNNEWMKDVEKYVNKQTSQGRLKPETAELIYDGFAMLDEAITQNRAENFAYALAGKRRPPLAQYINNRMFNSEAYISNFDYYGELQEPAIMFARTLRGIGKEEINSIKALNLLSERALSPDFFDKILYEYTVDNQMPAFILEAQLMGALKRASYANFGCGNSVYLNHSKEYLDELRTKTTAMRDKREPFYNVQGGR